MVSPIHNLRGGIASTLSMTCIVTHAGVLSIKAVRSIANICLLASWARLLVAVWAVTWLTIIMAMVHAMEVEVHGVRCLILEQGSIAEVRLGAPGRGIVVGFHVIDA